MHFRILMEVRKKCKSPSKFRNYEKQIANLSEQILIQITFSSKLIADLPELIASSSEQIAK